MLFFFLHMFALISKYEFGKLSIEKAQRLSDHIGLTQQIDKPMTIAEIANPHEKVEQTNSFEKVE